MNTIREDLNEYLAMRRALGFKLKKHGQFLEKFVCYFEEQKAEFITTKLAVEWAELALSVGSRSQRLSYLRAFARFRTASDPRTEVPPENLYPYRAKRAQPYLYSEDEVRRLLQAARTLPNPFRAETYHSLLGLMAVTGLRLGEILGLQMNNVDLDEGMLLVEGAKHGRSRLVPLHPSTQAVLGEYRICRDKYLDGRAASCFFISLNGTQLDSAMVHRTFYALSEETGLRKPGAGTGPRLHDFRHSFAVQTMLRWYRCGADVEQRLPALSAYLGHVHVSDTYWYLTAVPELMTLGVNLLAHRWEEE
ncbi:MAG: tyrosine-type recombinase/integrase [Candidatus Obscuribacterales bacterium]|nr:tyrosine-type recombinase/integrase [Candidatus Obscuribacterales bacterium]